MRFLHTSDWHLGRSFHREDLLGAQSRFVDFLVTTVRSEAIDAVLVSGDVYDRALPGVDAVALCNDALRRLVDAGARVVVISGNHDSARRLGFGADLIDAAGVHLRTDPARAGVPVLLPGGKEPVAVYGVPYLEPAAVREELLGDCGAPAGHRAVTAAALRRVRDDLAGRPGTRSVVLAHAFVAGGVGCESEREVAVGGAGVVPLDVFAGIDYVALGHLHGPQALSRTVRYSGSPVAYSFSEERHTKAVLVVDLPDEPGRPALVESLPAPVERPLRRLRGRLDDLLADPRAREHERSYLHVTLTDPYRPREAMARLRDRFPHTLVLQHEPEGGGRHALPYADRVRGRSDLQMCADFVEHVRGPADDAETELFVRALERARLREASA